MSVETTVFIAVIAVGIVMAACLNAASNADDQSEEQQKKRESDK